MKVVVLGASPKEERYSNRAVGMLLEYGHEVIPVHPAAASVRGVPCVRKLSEVQGPVHTLTVYLAPKVSTPLEEDILALRPQRVIFNPGAENPELAAKLSAAGIRAQEACTLVLLRTGRFEE